MVSWLRRLVALVRRRDLDDELADEIALHIDLRRQALIDDGMDPQDAERAARRLFGNPTVTRERARDLWRPPAIGSFIQDLRFGVRHVARRPGLSAVIVLMIALGTGLNAAVFVVFNAAVLKPPDIPDSHDVVRLDDGRTGLGPTYPDFVDYRDRAAGAADFAAYGSIDVTARFDAAGGRHVERVSAVTASGNYFEVLKAQPLLGRTFTGHEDLPPRGTPVVVLSEAYWTRYFAREPSIIGRTIDLDFHTFTIIGVLPTRFDHPDVPGAEAPYVRHMWIPLRCLPVLQTGETRFTDRTFWWGMQVVGRLKPGITLEGARAQVATIAASLDREYAGARHPRAPYVGRIGDVDWRMLYAEEAGIVVAVMGTATLLILLIACANVASLLLAQTCARSREIALRMALGAGRARIIRQFLTESLVLSLMGTAAGFVLAHWGLRLVLHSGDRPLTWSFAPDIRSVTYAACIAMLVAAAMGFASAIYGSKANLLPALKDGSSAPRASRLRATFVAAEVAGCLLLLVTTALLARTVQRVKSMDPIIPAAHLLTVDADTAPLGYSGDRQAVLVASMQQRLEALPGASGSALANPPPFSGSRHGTVLRRADALDAPGTRVYLSHVSTSFFALADLHLARGRLFEADDEVVISRSLATSLFGTDDPIGQRIVSGEFEREHHTVVGVVADAPFVSMRATDRPFMFRTIDPAMGASVMVRTSGPAAALANAAAAAVEDLDRRAAVRARPVSAGIDDEVNAISNGVGVAAALGSLALLLALFGVAAVAANSVVQRTHEIGVRMALGATARDATSLMMRQLVGPVVGGLACGLFLAMLLSRALSSQLYGLSSVDPIAFGSAALLMMSASIIAAWVPARRAARIDPVVALRTE